MTAGWTRCRALQEKDRIPSPHPRLPFPYYAKKQCWRWRGHLGDHRNQNGEEWNALGVVKR